MYLYHDFFKRIIEKKVCTACSRTNKVVPHNQFECCTQWPCVLRRRSAAARLLELWVCIQPRAWMFVCCEYCQVEVCAVGLITRSEKSYRLRCVNVCDLETS